MVDPRQVRLSEHFLLSDLMGCHSVYARGLPNIWDDPTGSKLAEAENLAQNILEPILEAYGPLSISYGYISPELSRQIVTYQDPDKPSYHRFDAGAAADICVHDWVEKKDKRGSAPILLAHEVDRQLIGGYSRMITYSESPYICIAGRAEETNAREYRAAFYENRYMGVPKTKPKFITMSKDITRRWMTALPKLPCDWRGAGYPTYHGGGLRQSHHIRVSRYTMLSDWLFNIGSIKHGIKNIPTQSDAQLAKFRHVGDVYDSLIGFLGIPRLSITQGWAGPGLRLRDYEDYHWTDTRFALVVSPPEYVEDDALSDAALDIESIEVVEKIGQGQWLVVGRFD